MGGEGARDGREGGMDGGGREGWMDFCFQAIYAKGDGIHIIIVKNEW